MQVPIRKPGKYTNIKIDPKMTNQKFNELTEKLRKLKKVVRPPLIKEVKRLALMGDFSENVAYSIAKGKLRGLNQRIIELEDLLKRAEIIEIRNTGKIQVGSTVTISDSKKEKSYQILGSSESAPERGVISHISPLGKALLGARAGDDIKVETQTGRKSYRVLKIE